MNKMNNYMGMQNARMEAENFIEDYIMDKGEDPDVYYGFSDINDMKLQLSRALQSHPKNSREVKEAKKELMKCLDEYIEAFNDDI